MEKSTYLLKAGEYVKKIFNLVESSNLNPENRQVIFEFVVKAAERLVLNDTSKKDEIYLRAKRIIMGLNELASLSLLKKFFLADLNVRFTFYEEAKGLYKEVFVGQPHLLALAMMDMKIKQSSGPDEVKAIVAEFMAQYEEQVGTSFEHVKSFTLEESVEVSTTQLLPLLPIFWEHGFSESVMTYVVEWFESGEEYHLTRDFLRELIGSHVDFPSFWNDFMETDEVLSSNHWKNRRLWRERLNGWILF